MNLPELFIDSYVVGRLLMFPCYRQIFKAGCVAE